MTNPMVEKTKSLRKGDIVHDILFGEWEVRLVLDSKKVGDYFICILFKSGREKAYDERGRFYDYQLTRSLFPQKDHPLSILRCLS